MVLDNAKPLIWFHHFHKAGGSSVVAAARKAGWVMFPNNKNGNPVYEDGSPIPIWDWDKYQLSDWLEEVCSQGINFIACEWGFSHDIFKVDRPGLQIVTVMRPPVERLISNYYFDVKSKFTKHKEVTRYIESPPDYTRPDYYTRMITGRSGVGPTRDAFLALKKFDTIAFLGDQNSFAYLESIIPGVASFHSNRTVRDSPELTAAKLSVEENRAVIDRLAQTESVLYDALRSGSDNIDLPVVTEEDTQNPPHLSRVVVHIGPDPVYCQRLSKLIDSTSSTTSVSQRGDTSAGTGCFKDTSELAYSCINDERRDEEILPALKRHRGNRLRWRVDILDRLNSASASLPRGGTLVLCSEKLGLMLNCRREINRLERMISPLAEEIEIFVTLPRQDVLARNIFNQRCFDGLQKENESPFNERITTSSPIFHYRGLVERWRSSFSRAKLSIRAIDECAYPEKLLFQDMEELGICASNECSAIPFSNLTVGQQHALIAINSTLPSSYSLKEKLLAHVSENFSPDHYDLADAALGASFYSKFKDSNDELAKQTLNGRNLFEDPTVATEPSLSNCGDDQGRLITDIVRMVGDYFRGSGGALVENISVDTTKPIGVVLKEIGLAYKMHNPRIALFLLYEAKKYRPKGPAILKAIAELEDLLSENTDE